MTVRSLCRCTTEFVELYCRYSGQAAEGFGIVDTIDGDAWYGPIV
jgi:hypothetical protein